jgi:hypothetical protein
LKGSPKAGTRGGAVGEARRRLVLRYYLRGLGPEDIVRQRDITASRATIYNDLQVLREDIAKKIEAAKLWPIKRHVLLQEELMREAWIIFHRPKEKRIIGTGENAREIEIDDSFRRLFAIDRIHKISEHLAKLAFPEKAEDETTGIGQTADPVKAAVKVIEGLPIEQRDKIISYIRSQVIQEATPRPA